MTTIDDSLDEPPDQPGGPDPTLDMTQDHPAVAQNRPAVAPVQLKAVPYAQFKPYDQLRQWDWVRMIVTVGLLLMLGWVIVWASIESASWPTHWAQTKEMLQTILPALTGLIGSVIGFYFGSGVNSSRTTSSVNGGSGK